MKMLLSLVYDEREEKRRHSLKQSSLPSPQKHWYIGGADLEHNSQAKDAYGNVQRLSAAYKIGHWC